MMNILVNIAEATDADGTVGLPGRTGGSGNVTDVYTLKAKLIDILNLTVQVLIAAAVVLFLFGVVKYIASGEDETKRKEAKSYIVYGIIGLFVMVSVWGLVGILTGTFGVNIGPPVDIKNLLPQ